MKTPPLLTNVVENFDNLKKVEQIQQNSLLLSNACLHSSNFDKLAIDYAQFVIKNILNVEKHPDSSINILKKVACVMNFPR